MTRLDKVTETDIKYQIKDCLDKLGIFNYHLLQGMASYKGLPDRVMHLGGEVVYLEVKKPKGALSPHQLEFQEQCRQDLIHYHVVRSLDDLMEIVSLQGKSDRGGEDDAVKRYGLSYNRP